MTALSGLLKAKHIIYRVLDSRDSWVYFKIVNDQHVFLTKSEATNLVEDGGRLVTLPN